MCVCHLILLPRSRLFSSIFRMGINCEIDQIDFDVVGLFGFLGMATKNGILILTQTFAN